MSCMTHEALTPIPLAQLFKDGKIPEGLEEFYRSLQDKVNQLNATGNYEAMLIEEGNGDEYGPYLTVSPRQDKYGEEDDREFGSGLWVGFSDLSGHDPEAKVKIKLLAEEVITTDLTKVLPYFEEKLKRHLTVDELKGHLGEDKVFWYFKSELEMKQTRDQLLVFLDKVIAGQRDLRPRVGDTTTLFGRPYTYEWFDLNSFTVGIRSKAEYDQMLATRKKSN